ncbi:MAG: hypothetical protein J6S98_01075 [Lentisphaeria bacterium]|nr:hypothetical protein [Lentisphaeria bacterium]
MMKRFLSVLAGLLCFTAVAGDKNVAQVEYRVLPPDFEKLPVEETEKWHFGFRPYSAESASFLWSDPNVIRDVTSGADTSDKHLATGLYVVCNEEEFSFLVYGALRDNAAKLEKGQNAEELLLECFFLPGDADDPAIENYQHFGVTSQTPHLRWKLSWMKEDRNVRWMFDAMKVEPRYTSNGVVLRFSVPWEVLWDKLPVFSKKKDNHWRLSMIRWGGSQGGETWGGVVHAQSRCGYLRMPDFTKEQQTAIMKTTLLKLWRQYQLCKNHTRNNPNLVPESVKTNRYRQSLAHFAHTWANVNEDRAFVDQWLKPAIAERDAIGKGLAIFEKMSLEEQKAFYLKNAPLLANFQYDIDDAYAAFCKAKLMGAE